LEDDRPKLDLSQSPACEQSRIVGNEHNRSGSRGMQMQKRDNNNNNNHDDIYSAVIYGASMHM